VKETKTKTQNKSDQLRLFMFQLEFIKTSVDLQAAFEAETLPDEGQWLEEQLNMEKLHE
jgi:hypothetical protein